MISWYPKERYDLWKSVKELMSQKLEVGVPDKMLGIVVPHAGYAYSGRIAGQGFGLMRAYLNSLEVKKKKKPDKVVVIGPSHYAHLKGAVSFDEKAFHTPLGSVPIYDGLFPRRAVEEEHSIENQVPFLQMLEFKKIIPIMVGELEWKDAREIAKKIAKLRAMYVFSSDLSHYLPYDTAVETDWITLRILEDLDVEKFSQVEACGNFPLMVLMELCKLKDTHPHILKYENSGDVTGDKNGVVGYASMWF